MKSLRMRTKLALAFGSILLLSVIMGAVAWIKMDRIDADAVFTHYALIPQTELAFTFAEEMREAGLNIRAFAASGDVARLKRTRDNIATMRQSLEKVRSLVRDFPSLEDIPIFLQGFPPALDDFSKAVTSIEGARQQIALDNERLFREGPKVRDAINELLAITNEMVLAASRVDDSPGVERALNKGDIFSTLFDMCEALQREFFTARMLDDRKMLDTVLKNFAEPLHVIDLMLAELAKEEDKVLLREARKALVAYQEAAITTVGAVDALGKADTLVINSFTTALELARTLAASSNARNEAIAANMNQATTDAKKITLIMLVGALLVGLLLTGMLTRSITGSLGQFVDAAVKLSNGQFDTRIHSRSEDEIGLAASHINKAFDVVVDKMLWYESMLDAIPSVISVTDMDRRWTFVNAAAEKAIGKSRVALLGNLCRDRATPICGGHDCGINCLEQGRTSQGGIMDGRRMAMQATYIKDRHGRNIGHIEVGNDVSDLAEAQRRAETALTEGMHAAAARIEGVVANIGSTMKMLSQQVEQSEQGASEQAVSMGETNHAMGQMNATVLEVVRNAGAASDVSAHTRQKAENGAAVVRQVMESIGHVQKRSQELKDDMAVLGGHASSINDIMSVISDIADQTNLLALNAAIEAARAGDAGRGFAVVADEVRKLAEKTMASTADVGRAIRAIQQSTEKSISQVEATVTDIHTTTELAGESGAALTEIVHMVDMSADQVRAIATAAEEQSASSEEINLAVQRVNGIATTTAAAMQKASNALHDLNHQAQELARLIEEMKSS